jgi:hypothetical protein
VIDPRHIELLTRSAIPIPLAERAGVRSLCGADTWEMGFGEKVGPGLAFPFFDLKTRTALDGFLQIRLDHPNGGGRYRQPSRSRNHLYIPVATVDDLHNPELLVILTEGPRKVLALVAYYERMRQCALVVGVSGVWSWRTAIKGHQPDGSLGKIGSKSIEDLDAITWTGRRVVIMFDSDVLSNPDVRRAERTLARELESRGAIVSYARIPAGPKGEKTGADDLLAAAGDDAMAAIIESAQSALAPEIIIGPDIPRVVDEAESALLVVGDLYSRGRVPVEVSHERARRYPWLTRPVGAPALVPLDEARLRELMADAARWMVAKKDKKTGEKVRKPAMPPSWVATTLMSRPSSPFPEIAMVSETPMFRPDGTILESPGYDERTGALLLLHETFPAVQEAPTLEDAKAAAIVLAEPFSDFPFAKPCDRSAALAAIMSMLARPAIHGPVPMTVADAPAQGIGKTLIADIIAIIATGRPAAKTPAPLDEAEASKQLLAIAIEALQIVLLDNLTGTLRSAVLSEALTATEWRARLLGRNQTVSAPLTTIWMATGNNCSFSSDIARRIVPIRLDQKIEHPEERVGFKHPALRAYVLAERPRLVTAALTVLRAYHVAGRPVHGKPPMGSFEAWDALVRGALLWAGEFDPLEGRARVRAEADVELEALRVALDLWSETFPEAVTAAGAVEKAKNWPELQTALAELAGGDATKLSGTRLGYALRRVIGRIVGTKSFEKTDKTTKGATWWIVVDHEKGAGGDGGHSGHIPNPSREKSGNE